MAVRMDPTVNAGAHKPASSAPAQVDANDFKQFAALRRADANDPKALREVARQFESIFTKMMLDSMRSASFGDPMFGSDQADMYQGMMDDQLAVQLTSGRGIGLADMLIRQLSQGGAVPDAAGSDAAGKASPEQQLEFIDEMLPQAEAAARELGVDARNIIAQAALETGWGASQPRDASGASNNYFGIKAGKSWGGQSVTADTTEFTGGVAGGERAQFRAYGSVAENIEDYVRVIRDNPRYADAIGTGSDVRAFANALQRGGYATDPEYANKLVATFEKVSARQSDAANVNRFKSADTTPIPPQELSNG